MGPLKSLMGATLISVSLLILVNTALSDGEDDEMRKNHGLSKRAIARPHPPLNRNIDSHIVSPYGSRGFVLGDQKNKRNAQRPWGSRPTWLRNQNKRFQRQTDLSKPGQGKNVNAHSANSLTNVDRPKSPTTSGEIPPSANRPIHPFAASQKAAAGRSAATGRNAISRPEPTWVGPNASKRRQARVHLRRQPIDPKGRSNYYPKPAQKVMLMTPHPKHFGSKSPTKSQLFRRRQKLKTTNTKSSTRKGLDPNLVKWEQNLRKLSK